MPHELRILYLEDHPHEIEQLLPEVQARFHAEVDLAENFEQAHACLQTGRYDLFLLDIEIDGSRVTGIRLAEKIRQDPRYVTAPIIFTSMHTHHSHRLLSTLQHISFLAKPFTAEQLCLQIGVALGLPEYLENYYRPAPLRLPISHHSAVEVEPDEIAFIEFSGGRLILQYINGEQLTVSRKFCSFGEVLRQIDELQLTFLRQIYRSIIVNVDQIRTVEVEKNTAFVWLFHDDTPKPLAYHYRKNIAEYLPEGGAAHEL